MPKYYQKLNNILFYILLGLMVFIPLYPKFPLINIKGSTVAVRVEDILIALTLAYWFILNIPKYKNLLSDKVTKSMLLFWGIGLLSVISGLILTFTVSAHLGILNWLRRVEDMSLLFVAWTTVTQKRQVKIMLSVMLVTTLLVVFYGFGQLYAGFPVISTTNSVVSAGVVTKLVAGARPNSTFAGYYDLAAYLSIALMFMGALFFYFRKTGQKAGIVLTGIISFLMLSLTAEREAFVATILGLMALFYLIGKKWLIVALIFASIAVVGVVPSLRDRYVASIQLVLHHTGPVYTVSSSSQTANSKVHTQPLTPQVATSEAFLRQVAKESPAPIKPTGGLPNDIVPGEPTNYSQLDVSRSLDIRLNVEWPRAIRAIEENPFLGTGYSSLTLATDNDYLRSLGETGILGTLAFALLLFIVVKRVSKLFKSEDRFVKYFSIAVLTSILAILVNGVFIDVFEASKVAELFWIIVGVNLAMERFS